MIFFVVMFCAFSCAPKKPPIERNHYILELSRAQTESLVMIPASLSVRDFSVSPGYQGKELIYKVGKGKAVSDFYNHFFILPGPMIAQLTRSWIKQAGLFQSVIPMSSRKNADYILEGAVSRVYADFQDRTNPSAVLKINFLLLKDTGFDYEIAFQREYISRTSMTDPSAGSMVGALNNCLSDILQSLEDDLLEAFQR